MEIELQGYASKVGNAEHNLKLSKERAANIRRALISNDIQPSRVKIIGHGDVEFSRNDTEINHHFTVKSLLLWPGLREISKKNGTSLLRLRSNCHRT